MALATLPTLMYASHNMHLTSTRGNRLAYFVALEYAIMFCANYLSFHCLIYQRVHRTTNSAPVCITCSCSNAVMILQWITPQSGEICIDKRRWCRASHFSNREWIGHCILLACLYENVAMWERLSPVCPGYFKETTVVHPRSKCMFSLRSLFI